MRNSVNTKMYCSIHTDVQLDVTIESKVHLPNAYEVDIILYVEPCSQCKYELQSIKYSVEETLKLLGFKSE